MSRFSLGVSSLVIRATGPVPALLKLGNGGNTNLVRSSSIVDQRIIARRHFSTSPRSLSETTSDQKPTTNSGTSSSSSGPFWRRGIQIQWIFGGLAGLGALITIYGLLEFYSTLTTWPKAVRIPLRAALKAKLREDYNKAELFFREALNTALEIGPKDLSPEPLLKISGIYVELANILEIKGQKVSAFNELHNALDMFGPDPLASTPTSTPGSSAGVGAWVGEGYILNEKDCIRCIGLHQKLGQLALEIATTPRSPSYSSSSPSSSLKTWDEVAEHYLSSALTAMLKLGLSSRPPSTGANGETQVIAGRDINLPSSSSSSSSSSSDDPEADLDPNQGGRVDKRGLGMTMESLSEVYARKKQYDLSAQLLLQAVSLLMPPGSKESPPVRDRCQAALLMTTISSHAAHPKTAQSIKVSKSWSLRSLQLAEQALGSSDSSQTSNDDTPLEVALGVCKRARSVGLYNLGMLAEMERDEQSALNYFNKALLAAREASFPEGKREALAAIRRIQSAQG